jgi:hypothetical protein
MVTVVEVDLPRKRIGLSMRAKPEMGGADKGAAGGPRQQPPRPASREPAVDWFTEAMHKGSQRK